MRFVIYSPDLGVYLGSALGLGFWSKLDPVGQSSAVTFGSEAECEEYMQTWNAPRFLFEPWEAVPVATDDGTYASIESVVAAGLPGWDPAPPHMN